MKRSNVFRSLSIPSAVLIACLLVIAQPITAHASSIGGRPARPRADNPRSNSIFVHEISPGASVDDAVAVINNSTEAKEVKLFATDSLVSSGGAFGCKQNIESATDAGAWIALEKSSITLAANERGVVPFRITVPQNASVGEHNACIAFQAVEAPVPSGNPGVQLSFRSAIRVAITVPGEIKKQLDFTQSTVTTSKDKMTLIVEVKNGGNVSLDTNIDAKRSTLGLFAKESKGGTFVVLPSQAAQLNFDYKKPQYGGWFRFNVAVSYNNDPNASLGENGAQTTLYKSVTAFIMPSALFLAIYGIVIASIGAGLYVIIRKRRSAASLRQRLVDYTVADGDDIQSIAQSLSVSWKTIASVNKLKAPYALKVGQIIQVPGTEVQKPLESTEKVDEPVPEKPTPKPTTPAKKKSASTKPTAAAAKRKKQSKAKAAKNKKQA